MKCLHLLPDTDAAGAERQALYLLRGLIERGVDCETAYFRAGLGHPSFEALGVPLRQIPRRRPLTVDLRRSRELRALYRRRPPDVLHAWLYEGNVVGLRAARGWPRTKVVITQRSGAAEMSSPVKLRLLRRLLGRADHAIANSQQGAALFARLGMPDEQVSVVRNGVPDGRVRPTRSADELRSDLGVATDAPLIVSVGRGDAAKDLATLLAAIEIVWTDLPDAVLVAVGPTPDDLAEIGGRPGPACIAVGWQENSIDFIAAADVVAISSWTEGHSNVADEALMLGRAVATTDTGGHVPLVRACGGRVTPIRDPAALAAAVVELVETPPDPAAVARLARRELAVDTMVEATIEVYECLLSARLDSTCRS